MTLGGYLKKIREERGLTLQQVGDAICISKGHLHGIESGRYVDIRLATAAALAVVLGVDIQILADLSLHARGDVRSDAQANPDSPPGVA